MQADARHPYETLTPDVVLDALASVGLYGDGRLLGLSSYENRVYQVHLEDALEGSGIVVAKFYRPGRWSEAQILEEHAFAQELQAAEVPAVAPLAPGGRTLHTHAGFQFSVSPRRGGRAPELDDGEVLEWIGRYLARLHTVGGKSPFRERPALDVASFGEEPRDWLLAHDGIPLDVQGDWQRACERVLAQIRAAFETAHAAGVRTLRLHGDCHPGNILWTPDEGPHFVDLDDARTGPAVQDLWMLAHDGIPLDVQGDWQRACERVLAQIRTAFAAAHAAGVRTLRLHGDCHPGNILWTPDEGPHFVDLDDARTGPAVQDLWMLLSGDRSQRQRQLGGLLDGYEQLRDFDRNELALIEPLRTLRLVHYSAWLARRWDDPAFPIAFPWFGTSDYWRGQVQMLEEQMDAMEEPALVA